MFTYCSYTGQISLSSTINSGSLCGKSKAPDQTAHLLFHIVHRNVIYCAIYYVATQVLENRLTLTLFTVKADLVNSSQKSTIFLKSLDTH